MLPFEQAFAMTERHYTFNELASIWNLSYEKVRRLFVNEFGTVSFGDTYRIPVEESKAHPKANSCVQIVFGGQDQRLIERREAELSSFRALSVLGDFVLGAPQPATGEGL